VEQGAPGDELYLVLDGVLVVEIDGEEVAEIGPGAVVGERALLEGGMRTATLRARTRCRVAVIPGELVDRKELEDLAATRRA
jgi:CRP-like cAMP-binding protein